MKKILFSFLFVAFFISIQVALGDPITFDITETPNIPIIKGKASNKPTEIEIAHFDYASSLEGDIIEASISGQWGTKNINKILKLDLYLDDTLLIDFGEYYSGLSKSEKRALKRALKNGEMIELDISIDPEDLEALMDGEASLYLVGKQKSFKSLQLSDITLRIVDPASDEGPGTQPVPDPSVDPVPDGGPSTSPVPEPTTMLLLGSGLIGLWGFRKKFKK